MNRGLSFLLLAPIGLVLTTSASADPPSADRSPSTADPSAVYAAGPECTLADDSTLLGAFGDVDGLPDEASPFSDCDPKEVKRYCSYRSKCRADEKPGAWVCKLAASKTFVARIPKRKSDLIPNCRKIRAKIRKICEPRG